MKITIQYHIEYAEGVIVCNSLEEVQRKIKNIYEQERYVIQTEIKNGKIINQILLGL